MVPVELRLNRVSRSNGTYYTIDKVWGLMNVTFGARLFCTMKDATTWASREWPNVPLVRSW